jgi:hypothetical protein
MQVVQTLADPPNSGSRNFPNIGCTRNSSTELRKMMRA